MCVSWILALAAGAISSFGCAQRGVGGLGKRTVAQAGSTMVDAPASPLNEQHTAVATPLPPCHDVPEHELTAGPLQNRHVLAVTPVREPFPQKGRRAALLGATVYISASPGLTGEWLGHLIECHISLGAQSSQFPDPLAVGGPNVDIVSTSNGFGVSITSNDPYQADRILRDSKQLLK
jgi:hypothetical protein